MIVICDTSCISALIQVDLTDILPKLFGEIIVPEPVYSELQALNDFGSGMPEISLTPWLKIKIAAPNNLLARLLTELDEGEAHAIALAVELNADLLIIDERRGRAVAESLKIPYTGLGGVLIRAKTFGLIKEVKVVLDRIEREAKFYLSEKARNVILKAAGETI